MKNFIIIMIAMQFFCLAHNTWAQGVAINTSGTAADSSAILDVSSTTRGMLIPRLTETQRDHIDFPETGLLIYQTDITPGFYYYNGTSWELIGGGGVSEIDDLTDGKTPANSTYLGSLAGASDSHTGSAGRNVGIGFKSLNDNTLGEHNTAIGYFSMVWSDEGDDNTAIGHRALTNNFSGNYNVAIGTYADAYNANGANNTIIGSYAGSGLTGGHTKSGSVFIGYQAGYTEITSNKLYIENSSSTTPLIYGEFDNDLLRVNGTFDINDEYQFPTTDGASGQVLQTNGSGALSWVTSSGGGGATSINDLLDAKSNGSSVYLGAASGPAVLGNNYNVGIGVSVLENNTTGRWNIAAGRRALNGNLTGESNIASGYRALQGNTDGDYNIALGGYSGTYNVNGSSNIILGHSAGRGLGNADHSKSGNVLIGHQAGTNLTNNSDYNIFLGYQAGYSDTTDNKLYIENSSSASPLIYGEFDNNLLRINGTLDINNNYQFPASDGSSGQVLTTNGSGVVGWATVGSGGGATQINDLTDAKTIGQCTFLGSGAGSGDNGSDNCNVAVGIDAQKLSTSGIFNTSIGYQSLYTNATGHRNAALGYKSLYSNSTGENNTSFGFQTAYSNTSGENNTVIGHTANYFNQEGSNNTIIGYQAGRGESNHNKTGNILLGYQAGYNETGSNKLYIENSDIATPLIYGEFDTDLLRINGTLDVNNAYQFPTADGASGQLLQTNGSGALSWTDVIGGASDIDGLTDGRTIDGSVYLGAGAGAVDDGTANKNVAIGISAMGSNTFGFLNTATGYEALTSNIGGNRNTANGYQALYTNSSGNYNTALGYQTLFTNSSGDCNVAVGDYALYHTTVNYSTAIGFDALYTSSSGEENTAVGYYAGRSNTTGSFNTVSGSRALYTNSTGSGNTASGYKAAYSNTSGTYNTAIGYESNLSQQGGSYNTTVGAEAGKTSVNHNKTGNVFIGYGAGRNVAANSNYNVFIGYEAGENLIANNLLYIENSNSALPLIYGDFEDDVVHINGELWVRSYYHFPTSTGSNGQIMKTNGTGTASWANIQIDELTDAKSDATNVFLGSGAGEDNNGTDHENVGVGINALTNNSTGEYNTAVGKSAMSNNVSGSSNTAVGWAAGPGYGHNSLTNTSAFGREASVVASNEISIGNGSVSWIGGNVTWSTFSDERGKNSIKEDVKGLDFIMKLRPVTYHIDKDKLDAIKGIKDNSYYPEKYDIEKIKQTGFLAQEVESAAKESNYDFSGVKAPVNENKPYSISYAEFVVPLVKAVQEQQLVIEELKKEIEELKSLSQNN